MPRSVAIVSAACLLGGLDLGLLLALGRLDQLVVLPLLLGRERRAGGGGVEEVALMGDGRRASWSCASGATTLGGPSKTSRSGLPTVTSTMLRIRSAPRPETMIQPRPSSQARFCRSRRNRGMSAPSRTKR